MPNCWSYPTGSDAWRPSRNAEMLGLSARIGSLEPGRHADLVVLDSSGTPAMRHRMETIRGDLEAELFVLMTLGDDRAVRAAYVQGRREGRRAIRSQPSR